MNEKPIERATNYPIHSLIKNRWSPRSMNGEPLTEEELLPLFEAARWAPSCFNDQPWHFIYAKKDSAHWDSFLSLLVPPNKRWAEKAGALVVIISRTVFSHNQKEYHTHSFDTGAAWMSLALEGCARDLVIHAMAGFDYEKAREVCAIGKDFQVEAMVAIGKKAPKEALPKDLQEKEFPTKRKPLNEMLFEGKFLS